MIEVRSVTKSFDGLRAIDDIDMTVKPGSIYGLVGTNGSGKTTILNMLCGVTRQDSGTIMFDGTPVYENPAVKQRLWYIPDDLAFYGPYTINELARFFSRMFPHWNAAILDVTLQHFHLDRDKRISRMSKGMRKQAVFALGFASEPDYLILDEPIDGLDPLVRKRIWELIVGASADRGMTTVISSHNLREMEGFCDSICAIDHGKVFIERDLDDLKSDIHKLQVSFGSNASSAGNAQGSDARTGIDAYRDLNVLKQWSSGSVDFLIVKNSQQELDRFAAAAKPVIFDRIPLTLEEIFIHELDRGNDEYTSRL